MSRGSIVSVGSTTGKLFKISLTDQMAPKAHILVYYVRDGIEGEIVADSLTFDVAGAIRNKVSQNSIVTDRKHASTY